MVKCDHCLLEVADSRLVRDRIKGQEKVFCCHGCRAVARLISEEGLEEFYKRRNSSWTPGPSEVRSQDPSAFSGTLRQAGDKMETDVILGGIRCASCIWLVEKILTSTAGVTSARVNYATHRARIRWNPALTDIGTIAGRITSIGYSPKPFHANAHEEELKRQKRDLLTRFGTAAFFSMQLMMYSIALYAGFFQGISTGMRATLQVISLCLATPVLFYSGMPFITGALRGLKGKAFNMDFLIITGAGSAYVYSLYQIITGGEVYFDTSAMIITLILLGRYIETAAKGRASEVITRLMSLNPEEARLMKSSEEGIQIPEAVPLSLVRENDLIEVLPGDRIPLDGVVTEGESDIDESMLTGESRPVSKAKGSEVFCGTQNLFGRFIFRVTRKGDETVLSQIIRTVEDAQARRAPVQHLVDRVVRYFVPAVLLLSAVTGIWWFYHVSETTTALMNAVSVLVIACPCALGLATPLAILLGTTRGASKGILIKGGDIVEMAKEIDTVVLDKTGTITEGRQELLSYRGVGISDNEALRLAVSLERLSEHTISKAIVSFDEDIPPYDVSGFVALPGRGVKGYVEDREVMAGSRHFIWAEGLGPGFDSVLDAESISWLVSRERSGATLVYLSIDRVLSGIFIISDSVRTEALEAVEGLREMTYDVFMVTGDSSYAAARVAGEVNLDEGRVMAGRSPVEKVGIIEEMQKKGKKVAMVGDGINDAPALTQAHVGIAMGKATDIALESADMVLMKNDLRLVPAAVSLSRRTYSIIKQNLFWAFVYNMIVLPLAVAGLLHPIIAAISMTLSSLSVVGNSLRLKRA
jgi:Cu2+-exporting ATPase